MSINQNGLMELTFNLMPKLVATVKKTYDPIEKSDYWHVVIDVYERGPNLTKEQAEKIAEDANKYFSTKW